MRVYFEQMKGEFKRVLLRHGFTEPDACAGIFAQNSLDGIYTHGLNRFPGFIQYIDEGWVKPGMKPVFVDGLGAIERWDGQLGPGMLNAAFCMDRAMAVAARHGIGCVAIRNNNHWMRGGTYGWQAAQAGFIGVCFTNTIANLPPWGGIDPRLGNNPLVIAVPRTGGHVVLDMAMSQYAYGKLLVNRKSGEDLPVPGGYDNQGRLSTNAAAIIESGRALPAGFWKGSGLALMLDLLASILSKGRTTADLSADDKEWGVSQVFIAIRQDDDATTQQITEKIIAYAKSSRLTEDGRQVNYPGEGTLRTRNENQKLGIPVDTDIWQQVLAL